MTLEILPVRGIGEVVPGDDLAGLIAGAAPWLRDGDVLVVTSKIVSKAEGRLVALPPPGPEHDRLREQVLAAETARPVAARGQTRIVATHHGFVMATAGIDASNVERNWLVLLPKDPDASARALRESLAERHGRHVAVIISDTMGRPWRNGLTDVALGAAGLAPLRDHRGETDPYGNELHVTQVAVADELAAAAELVKGKTDQIPVAVVRGHPVTATAGPGVVARLVRDQANDMFALGTAEARAAGLRAAARLPDPAPEDLGLTGPARPAGALDIDGSIDSGLSSGISGSISGGLNGGPGGGIDHSAAVAAVAAGVAAALATVAPVVRSLLTPAPAPAGAGSPEAGAGTPLAGPTAAVRCSAPDPADPAGLVQLGGDVHRLRAALAAEGLASTPTQPSTGTVLLLVRRDPAG